MNNEINKNSFNDALNFKDEHMMNSDRLMKSSTELVDHYNRQLNYLNAKYFENDPKPLDLKDLPLIMSARSVKPWQSDQEFSDINFRSRNLSDSFDQLLLKNADRVKDHYSREFNCLSHQVIMPGADLGDHPVVVLDSLTIVNPIEEQQLQSVLYAAKTLNIKTNIDMPSLEQVGSLVIEKNCTLMCEKTWMAESVLLRENSSILNDSLTSCRMFSAADSPLFEKNPPKERFALPESLKEVDVADSA